MTMRGKLDKRFGETDQAEDWRTVSDALTGAELYWLTTVRGRRAATCHPAGRGVGR